MDPDLIEHIIWIFKDQWGWDATYLSGNTFKVYSYDQHPTFPTVEEWQVWPKDFSHLIDQWFGEMEEWQ